MAPANLPTTFFGDNFGVKNSDLEKVLDTALAKKADYADLYFEARSAARVLLAHCLGEPIIPDQERIRIEIFLRDNLP